MKGERSSWLASSRGKRIAYASLFLLALELLLRLLLGNLAIGEIFLFHPRDGRCVGLKPFARVKYTGWFWKVPPVWHTVNKFGYRGNSRSRKKPKGIFRIVLLGDSFTYGQGVNDPQTSAVYLERYLRQHAGSSIQVLNFGVPGYNLSESLQQLKLFASAWQPDLVVLFLFSDDLGYSMCERSKQKLTGIFLHYLYLTRIVLIGSHLIQRLPFLSKKPNLRLQKKRLKKELEVLAETSASLQAQLAVVVLVNPISPYQSYGLRDIFSSLGVPWLDAQSWLDASSGKALPTIPREGHFSAEGNRRAARQIANWILEMGWLKKKE